MGYLYKGDAILKGNLSVATDKPLDERSIVQNATELLSVDSAYAYNGMLIVSIEDEAIYILLDKTNITNLSAWKKIGDIKIPENETPIVIDDELTEESSNPVKSSGIYNGVKTMINAKFVVLTEAEYKAMTSHDPNTFYYIKQ